MHSELIVMTFDCEGEARRLYDALRAMRRSSLLGLENATIVTKSNAGKVRLCQEPELPLLPEAIDRNLLDKLTDLIFGAPSGGLVGARAKAGLDERFVEGVTQTMGDGSSALFFWVRPDSMSDADELLSALGLFEGTIHRTTLSQEAEAALLQGRSAGVKKLKCNLFTKVLPE